MPQTSNLHGALLGLLAMGLFACSDITIKFLGSGYNPFQIIFFAGLMTFPLIAGLAMADTATGNLRPNKPRLMALRCGLVLLNGICGTYAFVSLPLAQAYAIFFMMPIFITLLAVPVLGEKIDLARGMAVVAGLVGVVIALDPGTAALQWGHLLALAGAMLGAGNYIIIRKTGVDERVTVLMLYPLVVQMIVAAAVLPMVYQPMPFGDLALTALMATVSFLGYLLIIAAYRRAPGIVVAPMQYSQIIWAAIMGVMLFDEHMSARTVVGTAVIIMAGIVIVTRQDRVVGISR
jgi:S-adenosylmethionine uptake transporter